jgi:hypothetical protein
VPPSIRWEGLTVKSDREIMEILEAYDLTECAHSAAQLAGCDEKTVTYDVAKRDRGEDPFAPVERSSIIDPWLAKIEEWVDHSGGKIRADVAHRRLVDMGFAGSERTTRRAVAHVKKAWRAGRRRAYRPWIPEPGMWLQFDWGIGPLVAGRQAWLWCAWLAWSRFRVVLPVWDRTVPSVLACLDATLRRLGGAPTYVLTDNEKTVTVDRIAGVAVRHPEMVAAGGHDGCAIATCEPADPESKGGSEHTVKLAKADVVPTEADLLDEYANFGELQAACEAFCDRVNQRVHRETARRPDELLAQERSRLHPIPAEPYAAALGETRRVGADQTVRWHSVRYSTPPGHVGGQVWCRVHDGRAGHHRPHRPRAGRDRPACAVDAGLPADRRRALSRPRPTRRPQAPATAYPDHRGRAGLPRSRRRGAAVADRGRRRRRGAHPHQDGPGRGARLRRRGRARRPRAGGRRRPPAVSTPAIWPPSPIISPPAASPTPARP